MPKGRHLYAVDSRSLWECPRDDCRARLPRGPQVSEHRLVHDLADLHARYARLEDLIACVRVPAQRGGGTATSVPLNLSVLDFVGDCYEAEVDGVVEVYPGVKATVVDMERTAIAALGRTFTHRARGGYDGLGVDPRIVAALGWLRDVAGLLAERAEHVVDELREQAARLNRRAAFLLGEGTFRAGEWSLCPVCGSAGPTGAGTVLSDYTRGAFCTNPDCRDADGGRHCWAWDGDFGEWVPIPQPQRSERGTVIRPLDPGEEALLLAASQQGVQ